MPLPYFVVSEVSKTLDSKWRIDGLWQKIDMYAVNRVLNTIRLGITGEIVRMLEESGTKKAIKTLASLSSLLLSKSKIAASMICWKPL
jgi:hypothetical protein